MTIHATINTYQQKHALYPPLIPPPPPADLGLVVVIPCCNEPDVFATLHALWSCSRPACSTEIILVINHAATSPDLVRSHNLATKQAADAWVTAHHDPKLCIHPLFFPDLPDRHAGVGLARKIGMDEAAHRLASVGNNHGVIACIDADCDCSPNYLTTLHDHFRDDKKTPGCVIHFEHRYGNLTDPSLRDAIVQYELYLRYHVRGLDCAGSPYAFHTVGSCMAVRASVYMRQGGIKPRKGGEDFYFIQKMIGLGNLTKIRTATVYPASRLSTRTPFGTGQAMLKAIHNPVPLMTNHPQLFLDIQHFYRLIPPLYDNPDETIIRTNLPPYMIIFLDTVGFSKTITEIRANVSSVFSFQKRFHLWFNAFKIRKFLHRATESGLPGIPIQQAAVMLLHIMQAPHWDSTPSQEHLLKHYRDLDLE